MAIFHTGPENDSPAKVHRQPYKQKSCALLHFGPIALFRSRTILEAAIESFRSEGYIECRCDSGTWETDSDMYKVLSLQLGSVIHPHDEADDLLEVEFPDHSGRLLIFDRFDAFAKRNPEEALRSINTLDSASRRLQLFGKTLVIFLQSNDPHLELGPIGSYSVHWNQKEFVRANRE
jgi:hypothetical protein